MKIEITGKQGEGKTLMARAIYILAVSMGKTAMLIEDDCFVDMGHDDLYQGNRAVTTETCDVLITCSTEW